jgi:hypothetical protein
LEVNVLELERAPYIFAKNFWLLLEVLLMMMNNRTVILLTVIGLIFGGIPGMLVAGGIGLYLLEKGE